MTTRRRLGAAAAALVIVLACPAQARRLRADLAPTPHANAMVDERFAHLRLPEAYASARARDHRHKSSHTSSHPRPAPAGFFMRRI